MAPSPPISNPANGWNAHRVFLCQRGNAFAVTQSNFDLPNFAIFKFCRAHQFADFALKNFYTMLGILLTRNPLKVVNSIIIVLSVLVVNLMPLWAWANKGFAHKPVNRSLYSCAIRQENPKVPLPVFIKTHHATRAISPSVVSATTFSSVQRANATNRTNFIYSLVTDNRPPLFRYDNVSHNSYSEYGLGLGPNRYSCTNSACFIVGDGGAIF